MKKLLPLFLFLSMSAGLLTLFSTGCQTTSGFGEDVENLGESIQGD